MIVLESGFKDTELGPLPFNWEIVPLEIVVTIHDHKRIPLSSTQRASMQGIFPYCGANGIIDHLNDYIFDGEYVLLAEDGGYWDQFENSSYVMKGKFWVNNHAHILQAIADVSDNHFLMYLLNFQNISLYISGTTRGKLNQGVMRKLPITLPPLPEQRAIAHVLTTVRQAINAAEQVLEAARQLKKAMMKYLFTYGPVPITERDKVSLRETENGLIPSHWCLKKLSEVTSATNQIDPTKQPQKIIRYIDISSVSNEYNKIIDWREVKGMEAPSRARKIVLADDIIFSTVRPYLKNIAQVPDDLKNEICSTGFCVIRPNPDVVDPKFLFYEVTSEKFVDNVSARQSGSSYPAVTDKVVLNQPIPYPPIKEQKEISKTLMKIDQKLFLELDRKIVLGKFFNSLLEKLMTGKVRIKYEQ